MKLIVQPDDGVTPIVAAIRRAQKSLDVVIFRLDRADVAEALQAAVARGVNVRALTAHTNHGGERRLRRLEMDLLDGGVTVSRSADDLVRYHGKMLIADGVRLHVYGFNFTHLDIHKSRSFGVVTRHRRLVQEAQKLFDADFNRQTYTPGFDRFVVSPENARGQLARFIRGARRQLLIYDPEVSDPAMLRLLAERAEAGVDVRIIGKVGGSKSRLCAEAFPGKRLHVRAIVRDGRRAFLGSQSLRKLELEKRREVGVIIFEQPVVRRIQAVFESDWAQTDAGKKMAKRAGRPSDREAAAGHASL